MFNRILTPQIIIGAAVAAFLTISLEIVASLVVDSDVYVKSAIVVTTIVLLAIGLWVNHRNRYDRVDLAPPRPLRSAADRMLNARRGMIAFVSLYNPKDDGGGAALSVEERLAAAAAQQFEQLDLERSNLEAVITTIGAHASKLEYCWLISTTSVDGGGSLPYAAVLKAYLEHKLGRQFQIFAESNYAISMDDDALVATKTHDLVAAIFKEAHALGLRDRDVVADFSGCPRSMAFGMIAACIDRERVIQFAGTRYDSVGRPTRPIFPILFDYSARMNQSGR